MWDLALPRTAMKSPARLLAFLLLSLASCGVVPLPIGPSGHGMQRLPHVASEKFETHWPLHSWYPTLQAMAQVVPLHDAVPFEGIGHGVQLAPHVETEVFATH